MTNINEPDAEAAPVLRTKNGRLVTEREVRLCMEDGGDLAEYIAGRILKFEAYGTTLAWLNAQEEELR